MERTWFGEVDLMLQVIPLEQIERIAIALRGRHAPVTRWRKKRALSHLR